MGQSTSGKGAKAMTLMEFEKVISTFEPVLGLEVHVELNTKTKVFCSCATNFGAAPNTNVCPTCLGLPGSLPVLNEKAIESIIKIGLALNCKIAPWSRMARKNYFYPDMPKDFQISQYDEPICFDGYLDVVVPDGENSKVIRIGIERVHLEEDTGKLTHAGGSTGRIHGADYSLVDYNRAGIPLVEIVTKIIPDTGAAAPEVAKAYVSALRDLIRNLDVSDVRMEEGSLRCDVNVSLMPIGSTELGTRTETKNVNSLRSVERAVRFEMQRQATQLTNGERVIQETRHFHENNGSTSAGRSKEQAEEYRYFPEPDLLPIAPSEEWIEQLRASLPEAPAVKRSRLQLAWGVSDFEMLSVINAGAVDLVEATVALGCDQAAARKWWIGEITRIANEAGTELDQVSITPAQVAELEQLVQSGTLNDKLARQVIAGVVAGEGSPNQIVTAKNLAVVSDDSALLAAIEEAITASPDVVAKIQEGKLQAAGALIGSVMKLTKGQADAAKVRELLLDRLGISES
jgi:aspartyl-tRNA(Asn)/glutamyl-tRNA(Gln) amidotransferase subunit B